MTDLFRLFRGPLTASPLEPVLRFVPAAIHMTAIFLVSSIPGEKITFQFDDRVAHFVEYFVLGLLLAFAVAGVRGGTGPVAAIAVLAFVAAFALADEFHQSLVPHRDASAKDWLFDMLGATAAILAVRRSVGAREAQ